MLSWDVMRYAKPGGPAISLTNGSGRGWALAQDVTALYWTVQGTPGSVLRVAK